MPDLLGALGLSRDVEFLALLLIPALVTLAYAVIHALRPVSPLDTLDSQPSLVKQQP